MISRLTNAIIETEWLREKKHDEAEAFADELNRVASAPTLNVEPTS